MDMLFARPSTFNMTVCSGWDILTLFAVVLFDIGFTSFYGFLPSYNLMQDLFMTSHKSRFRPWCKILQRSVFYCHWVAFWQGCEFSL